MAAVAGAAQGLDRWVACAVALTRLPAVGSEVYYFSHGHAEQFALPPQAGQAIRPCTVTAIQCFTAGQEPYARISLLPVNHTNEPAADTRPNSDSFVYFAKPLAHADEQRAYLAVPKLCGESLFPAVEVGNITQELHMSDLNGEAYEFVHKVAPKHDLKGDWPRFVAGKDLHVGDMVVFIRRTDLSFIIEARRQQPVLDPGLQAPLQELQGSSQLAAQGAAFTVTYYPGRGSGSPFVVPRGAVEEAMGKQWETGVEVRMRPTDLVLRLRAGDNQAAAFELVTGTISSLTPGLGWRNLEVFICCQIP